MKPWYARKSLYSAVVTLAAAALGFFGHNLGQETQQQIMIALFQLGSVIGAIFTGKKFYDKD